MLTENARAREEAERRIAAANRRMDHLERARREEEAPLLERAYQKKVLPPPSWINAQGCTIRPMPYVQTWSHALVVSASIAPWAPMGLSLPQPEGDLN